MFKLMVQWISAHPLKAIIAVALISSIIGKNIPKSDEQIAKEEQKKRDKQQEEELQAKQRQEREDALQKHDDEETQDFIKSKENTRPLKENTPISKKREKRVEKISKISKIIQFFQKKLCFKKQSFFL